MKIPYSCPYCNHRSTRRWNLEVHIKRRHGGFLVDKSDRCMGSNPISPNNPYHNIGSTTIADSVGNTFEPTYLRQQAPVRTSQYSTSPIHLPTMDEQRYESSLSRETKLKELKRLAFRYPRFHNTYTNCRMYKYY